MVRILLDTNIIVSGLLYPGKPRKLIDMAVDGRIELVSSIEMINELKEVLARKKFGFSIDEQKQMIDFIIRSSHIIIVHSKFKIVKDADDDIVVNTAYDGNASYIVSGDKAVLELKQFGRIKIVKASKMLELISKAFVDRTVL